VERGGDGRGCQLNTYVELGWFLFIDCNDNCIVKQFENSCILILKLEYH
jgi:hypothetical protein